MHWRKVKGGWRGKKEQGMVGREGSIEAGEERERGGKENYRKGGGGEIPETLHP